MANILVSEELDGDIFQLLSEEGKNVTANMLTGALVVSKQTDNLYGMDWFYKYGDLFMKGYCLRYGEVNVQQLSNKILSLGIQSELVTYENFVVDFIALFLSCNDDDIKKILINTLFYDNMIEIFTEHELKLIGVYSIMSKLYSDGSKILEYLSSKRNCNDIVVAYRLSRSFICTDQTTENPIVTSCLESYKTKFESGQIKDENGHLIYRFLGNYYNRFNHELSEIFYQKGLTYNDNKCYLNLGYNYLENNQPAKSLQIFQQGYSKYKDNDCAYGCYRVYMHIGDMIAAEYWLNKSYNLGHKKAGNDLLNLYLQHAKNYGLKNSENGYELYILKGKKILLDLMIKSSYEFNESHILFYADLIHSGESLFNSGDYHEALESLRKIVFAYGNISYLYLYFSALKGLLESVLNGEISKYANITIEEYIEVFESELVHFNELTTKYELDGIEQITKIIEEIQILLANKEKNYSYTENQTTPKGKKSKNPKSKGESDIIH